MQIRGLAAGALRLAETVRAPGTAFWLSVWALLLGAAGANAQPAPVERSWTRVQLLSTGAIDHAPKGARATREITLALSPTLIRIQFRGGPDWAIQIPPDRVTALNYGGHKVRRKGFYWVALASPVVGLALAETAKGTGHFIGLEYNLQDGRQTGVLLRADKRNYQEIIEGLRAVLKIDSQAQVPVSK